MPISSHLVPSGTIKPLVDSQAVEMTANAPVSAPKPSWAPVVMVASPEVPVRTDPTPVTLIITIQSPQTIAVHANSAVATPDPAVLSMEVMIVVIASPEMPVLSHGVPSCSSPALVDAPAVEVARNTPVTTPDPARSFVVVIPTPEMPVRPNSPPMALVVAIQGAIAITVHPNPPVTTPHPLVSTMEMVVVMIFAVEVPIAADVVPASSVPAAQDSQTVQMTRNAAVPAPEPTRSTEIPVALPQVPVRAHSTPMALIIAVQGAVPVPMHTNTPVSTPDPFVPTMEMMIVVVAAVQMPVAPHVVPTSSRPTLINPQAVSMATNLAVTIAPNPAWALVVMVATVQVPI